jgi:hypothetical protein
MATEMTEWRDLATMAAALALPTSLDDRVQGLMDRNNEGLLSPSEKRELEAFASLSESLSLLRANALRCLRRA